MHKTKQHKTKRNHHNTRCMWFTPSVGAMSTELCFIQLFTKNSYDLRTQLQIPAHSAAGLLNNPKTAHLAGGIFLLSMHSATNLCALSYRSFLTKPSVHSAAEVIHAHSWDLTLNLKTGLSFASNYHHTKGFE